MNSIKHIRNLYFLIADLIIIIVSILLSYLLRLELFFGFRIYLSSLLWFLVLSLFIKPFIFFLFGMYRRMWIYASTKELRLVVISVSTASLFVAIIMLLLFYTNIFTAFPRSVLIIDWALSLVLIGGSRFLLRLAIESRGSSNYLTDNPHQDRVLIVGAGDAGAIVVKELQKTQKLNLIPIGFLDDDPTKKNMVINDIRVIGTVTEIQKVLENYQVDEVIIAIPSAPGRVARLVTDGCHKFDIPFRTIPGIYELIEGSVGVSRLRTVQITDLLRRKPTRLNDDMIRMKLQDKSILVTGAGGSIGSELCRQISRRHPDILYLLGHGENSIFEIHQELKENHPSVKTIPIIADIRDINRLKTVYQRYTPQIVFHAAAHKHVPLMEYNIEEAITNNIIGTSNIVKLCTEFNIERLVMISTDKAIHPINIMGASKRMAEMVVLDEAQRVKADYSVVRFGNVLGSRGSVVPIFKNQIAKGGPVTITHPDMKRYFMTIPEAVYLVLQSATFGKCGDIFVLNMGEQTRILDLAEDLIRLSGLEPGRDIEIVFTGIRPGDKLSEDLWDEGHIFKPTPHPDIFRLDNQNNLKNDELETVIQRLIELAVQGKPLDIIKTLEEVIPDAKFEKTQVEHGNINA